MKEKLIYIYIYIYIFKTGATYINLCSFTLMSNQEIKEQNMFLHNLIKVPDKTSFAEGRVVFNSHGLRVR